MPSDLASARRITSYNVCYTKLLRIDFVTQALVMAELARGDSAVSKTFSQCWKWSHVIQERLVDGEVEGPRLPDPVRNNFV